MNLMSSIDENELPVTDLAGDELWYKDAIIYQLHVKAFADSNNDGIGDFAGLTEKLGYLQELGVTALWLLPFYPSPGRDDGYDIADYGAINPDFGTMKDFRRFIVEAKRCGLRVITELVINHTSDQHDWFKRARRSDPKSSARNWYVWSDTDQKYAGTRIIFTDTEKSNWTWDPEAGQFYWHRFFSHQPDLNFDNPRVVSALVQVMKRWLDTGVDGFRLDAIPYLCERDGTNNENLPETHAIIKALRAELDAYAKGKVLLAEANQWPEDVQEYFGAGDECHMAYHFPLMPRIYMAIAQEDRFPITDILRQTPDIPGNCQWALFLRNHDELTLEMVTDVERDYLWSTYANDPRARINVGIRRRLAPLMDNDRRKIELMNSMLLSFPGTPIIYYGDEIGMGDNIYLGDRNGVRTPMQWSPDRNGGFSRADPARLYAPTIMDPVYGYQAADFGAKVDAGVRPRHHEFHPSGQSLGAGLYQAVWRRGDPLRRQPVSIGASHRTRPFGLEGPYSPGNARPHAFPADRRIALHDHAGAVWLLLVPAEGARQIRACRTLGGSGIRDPCGAAGRDLGVAGPHPGRVRARRLAGTSGTDPLVPGAFGAGDSSNGELGDSVLRYRRQPALACLFRSDDGARRDDTLRIADADRMGTLRSRAL
jgi:trehalose synthase